MADEENANVPTKGLPEIKKPMSIWKKIGIFFLVVFVVQVTSTLTGINKGTGHRTGADSSPVQQYESPEERACKDDIAAFVESQGFVKLTLKAPTTASFSSRGASRIKYLGDCKHEVLGYVDAQNSFGAMIRTEYDIVVQYNKASGRWVPLSFNSE